MPRRRPPAGSLHHTILAAVFGLTLLVLVTFSAIVGGILRQETARRARAEATLLAAGLKAAAEEAAARRPGQRLSADDLGAPLARTLEAAVARSAPIVSLRLLDGEGRTVVRWEDGTAAGDDLEELTLPVAPAGEVRVGLSRAAIGAEGGLARGRVVLAALALAATALAVALLVSRRITRPLVMLNMEALLVAKGELDGELPVRGRNEIAQLAASFNRMIRALREMRARDRASNPLTGLPGNERVLAELSARLARGEPFAACYVDIDHFKAYNDQYGFVRGDEVLLALGRMLEGVAAEEGGEGCFVGHIGGDDFLVVCAPERAEPLARAAVARFDAAVPGWYAEADRERGCLVTVDRQGREARVPLMSLSVAIVTNRHRPLAHPGEVAQIAAQLKQKAKATPGSTVVVDQRRSWEGRLPDRRPAAGGGGLSGPTAHA